MKVEEIERLLAEFYEGTTTESQEEVLRNYFRTTEVPGHLLKDKEIFLNLCPDADQDIEVPAHLEDNLNLLIDEMAEKEQHFFRPNNSKNSWRWIGGVAATILLLIGIGYGIDNLSKNVCPPTPQDTFSDPEEAYRMLQATLLEISANLNYGLNEVKESQIDMRKIHQEVRNAIMKTMKFILACVLLLSPLLCQAQKNLFNKYNDMKGVSSVYISKAMMELNPNLFMKDLYIGKVAEHLNSVQVLSTHDNKVREEMAKDIRSLVQSSKYELLMKQKSTVSGSEVYVNRKGSKVKELIMVMNGASSLKFVYMEGDMTTDDIKKLMLYQSTSQNFIISGDLFYANNKPVTYFKKGNSDNQKDMAELSGTYNLNSIDTNYKEELSTLNDKLKRIDQGLKNMNIK